MSFSLSIPQLVPPPNKSNLVDSSGLLDLQWNQFFNSIPPATSAIDTALTNVASIVAAQGIFPVTNYGAVGDGVTDDGPAFRAAVAAAYANGGGTVFIPATDAFYNISTSINNLSVATPVTFQGAGRCSLVERGANMPTGLGVFDINSGAKNVTFDNFQMDGAVLVPNKLTYAAFGADPLSAMLTENTSFWIHDGSSQIRFSNMVISHTGGYAVLANAVAQDITDLFFFRLQLENNRPNLFGTNPADINYGSWTGGVLFHGNGVSTTAMIRRAYFLSCTANWCTGNCFWQHLYGFSSLHESIHFTDIHGQDIGRDLIEFGGVMGYTAIGGTARRVGYVSLQDGVVGTPRYLAGNGSVAIDHSGLALGGVMNGWVVTSPNGAAFDCDGMGYSSIVGCQMRVPDADDPEYVVDQINSPGFLYGSIYGIQPSNSSNQPNAGENNMYVGNVLKNFMAGAIRLFASRNSSTVANQINHPANAALAPIVMGPIGTGPNQRCTANCLSANTVTYDPTAPAPCVVEDAQLAAFTPSDANYVMGTIIVDPVNKKAFPFSKDPNSSSVAAFQGAVGMQQYLGGMLLG